MGVDVWVEAAQTGAQAEQPLGELLLSRGLLTPEQLEQALAQQREHKRPLGEIIVRLGFTTGPTIAQALATQHGRIFKSEYGFATGFDAKLAAAEIDLPPVTVRDGDRLTLVPPAVNSGGRTDPTREEPEDPPAAERQPEIQAEVAAAEARLDQLAEQLAGAAVKILSTERDRDAALAALAESEAAYATLEESRQPLAERVETLESELAQTRTAVEASRRATEREERELRQWVARLEANLNEARRERDEATAQLHTAEDTNSALRRELEAQQQKQGALEHATNVAELEERLASAESETGSLTVRLEAALAERDRALAQIASLEQGPEDPKKQPSASVAEAPEQAPVAEAPEQARHLVFFHVFGHGYVLLEREGPAPAVGDAVDMSLHGGSAGARVTRIAASPLEATGSRCAYLL